MFFNCPKIVTSVTRPALRGWNRLSEIGGSNAIQSR